MIAISNSEIATWDRCRRQWLLKYYMGFVPVDEPPVSNQLLGTRVHAALEGWYGYDLPPADVIRVIYALAVDAWPAWKNELLAEQELALAMVTGYTEWVAETGADAGLRVVATERELEVPFPAVPGTALKARLDQVVYDEVKDLLSFLDHKTAATFDAHELLDLNPQFKFYSVMQRLAAGNSPDAPRVSGGLLNTLRRVKRTEKARPPYYQRDAFRYTDEQLESAELRIEALVKQIMTARRYLDWAYREQGGALATVNRLQREELAPTPILSLCRWDCPFLSLCPMMDDGSDWPGVLLSSGKYRQADPYQYYREDPLRAVREALAK